MVNFPLVDGSGGDKHVVIGFQGWNKPGDENAGEPLDPTDPSTLAKLIARVRKLYLAKRKSTDPMLAAVAYATDTWDTVKTDARNFIRNYRTACYVPGVGPKLIIYGYSWGGDTAVELCQDLKKERLTVDLLITVDAALGPFSKDYSVRDVIIPSNVRRNLNYLTSTPKSRIGSRGVKHVAKDPKATRVENITVKGVTHGNMDEHFAKQNIDSIVKELLS